MVTRSILAVAFVVTTAVSAGAQTAAQIFESARAASVRRAAGVNNYTIVIDIGGVEQTGYFVKQMVDGYPVFLPPSAERGRAAGAGDSETEMMASLVASKQFQDRAKVEGTETVDGKRTHKIVVSDLAGIDVFNRLGTGSFRAKTVTMYMDAAQYVPLKITMTADVIARGTASPVTFNVSMQDYRTVQGMLHPFKTVTVAEGLANAVQMPTMTPAQMEQMKAQMAQLPPDQRARIEQAMAMMGGAEGSKPFETVTTVKSLRVNTGPP